MEENGAEVNVPEPTFTRAEVADLKRFNPDLKNTEFKIDQPQDLKNDPMADGPDILENPQFSEKVPNVDESFLKDKNFVEGNVDDNFNFRGEKGFIDSSIQPEKKGIFSRLAGRFRRQAKPSNQNNGVEFIDDKTADGEWKNSKPYQENSVVDKSGVLAADILSDIAKEKEIDESVANTEGTSFAPDIQENISKDVVANAYDFSVKPEPPTPSNNPEHKSDIQDKQTFQRAVEWQVEGDGIVPTRFESMEISKSAFVKENNIVDVVENADEAKHMMQFPDRFIGSLTDENNKKWEISLEYSDRSRNRAYAQGRLVSAMVTMSQEGSTDEICYIRALDTGEWLRTVLSKDEEENIADYKPVSAQEGFGVLKLIALFQDDVDQLRSDEVLKNQRQNMTSKAA